MDELEDMYCRFEQKLFKIIIGYKRLTIKAIYCKIHICIYEGKPKGMAHTELFDLVLMDGGQGNKPTEETVGRVLLSLAEKMSENELDDDADLARVERMLTHGERVEVYGSESLT